VATLPKPARTLRFGAFEADLQTGELWKSGMRQKLPGQAFQVLQLLLERPHQLVTREDFRERLWPDDTHVDYDLALKKAINRVREVLGDSAESPRFIETLPRRGYRFIGAVEPLDSLEAAIAGPSLAGAETSRRASGSKRGFWTALVAAAVLIAAGAAVWLLRGWPAYSFHPGDFVLITDFENRTGDPRFDDALLTAFTIGLEQSRYANVYPRTRIPDVLKRMQKPTSERITPQLGLEICQRENIRGLIAASITRTGQEYAVSVELMDPQSGAPVRSYTVRSSGEDHILDALDTIAGHIRSDLGESLYQIHRASRPLPQVTTRSLAALKDYADGAQLWSRGKFDDAMARYHAAVAADPDFAVAHAALGNAYSSHIFYQRELGKQEYEKALALSSRTTDRERLFVQAKFADNMNHPDAGELYARYLSRYPDDLGAHYNYARLLRMHGRQQEGIAQDREIVRIAPTDARAFVDMATAYKTLGNFPEALSAYARAFQLEPTWLSVPNVNQEYGFTLVANGEEEKAKQAFAKLLENPKTRAAGLRALVLLDLYHGRYGSAQHSAEEALSTDEKQADTSLAFSVARDHFLLAVLAAGRGDRAKQIHQLDAALADFKDLGLKVVYGSMVGQEYARAGAVAKAQEVAARIAPVADPNDREQTGYLSLLKGEIAAASGKHEEAERLLLITDPQSGTAVLALSQEALGHTYQQAGNWSQAAASYERFVSPDCPLSWVEASPRCQTARLALAECYLASGDGARAQQALAPLLERWKDAGANVVLRKQMLELEAHLAH
jgi:DNA-binding winged helix-turn-helix (wHTH) protein/tetratricopeptide (TPR) repeat protein